MNYCFTCTKLVRATQSKRCPYCKKLLWEALAKIEEEKQWKANLKKARLK